MPSEAVAGHVRAAVAVSTAAAVEDSTAEVVDPTAAVAADIIASLTPGIALRSTLSPDLSCVARLLWIDILNSNGT